MSEIKSRSIRLDDENWQWLSTLPGRSANDAVSALRDGQPTDTRLDEALEHLRSLPETFMRVMDEYKARKVTGVERAFQEGGAFAPYPTATGAAIAHNESELRRNSDPQSNLLPCRHCGEDGKISPRTNAWRACGSCAQDGHFNASDCRRCLEVAHAKKLASSATGVEDPSVKYDWKDPA